MADTPDPSHRTIADLFRVVNEMRAEQAATRVELAEFREDVANQLGWLRGRVEGQTESALNAALHVLGEQRGKLREVVAWANTQGAKIEELP